jgi:hypothetical protein
MAGSDAGQIAGFQSLYLLIVIGERCISSENITVIADLLIHGWGILSLIIKTNIVIALPQYVEIVAQKLIFQFSGQKNNAKPAGTRFAVLFENTSLCISIQTCCISTKRLMR